jgi:hypothetical protein
MKARYYIFILLSSITASAQELVSNNTVYGQITSTLYKEARIVRPIRPAQFHELSVLYDDYQLNFKYEDDYLACFYAYPKKIDWELTEEELRNLRNFIRRNGGDLPKTIQQKISVSATDVQRSNEWVSVKEDDTVNKAEVAKVDAPVSNTETVTQVDTDVVKSVNKDSTTWTKLSNDLDSSKLIVVANAVATNNSDVEASGTINIENDNSVKKIDQMRAYKRKGVIYRNDTLSVKQAKLIAMNQNFTAYRQFAAAQRIRGWNTFWGIVTVPVYPIVIITGPAIAVRESIRKRRIEKAVEAYNISIITENKGDIKILVR